MRLFIALDIPADIRERLAKFMGSVHPYAPGARWVKPESLHVTLKFLGEVPESKLEAIQTALRQVEGAPFPVTFKGTGFFPSPRSARVFWVGVEGTKELPLLAGWIDAAMRPLGLEPEQREFSPHLTLARKSEAKRTGKDAGLSGLSKALAQESETDFGTMTTEEFFLFQSKLSPHGASYTKLMRFPLGAALHSNS